VQLARLPFRQLWISLVHRWLPKATHRHQRRGFRDRAAERVTLELGPRTEQGYSTRLEREVDAERCTSLDQLARKRRVHSDKSLAMNAQGGPAGCHPQGVWTGGA
jgi:hypothetical protein